MTRSRIFWLAWLLPVFSLYFFENNSGTRIVLSASILVPLFSAVCAALCAARMKPELILPEKVISGQTVQCRCVLNGAVFSAGCLIRADLWITNRLTGESSLIVPDFGKGDNAEFTLSASHCGHLTVTLENAAVSDWFGLWQIPVSGTAEAELTVYPDLYPVRIIDPDDPGGYSGDVFEQRLRYAADPTAYGDIREYVPGDPVRRIHWKLSEKTGHLLIREDALSAEKRIRLALFPAGPNGSPERISETVEAFLSASRSLCGEGYRHEAVWPDPAGDGPASAEVGSEREFQSLQEAVLCMRSDDAAGQTAAAADDFPEGRLLIFDGADELRCTRDDPLLEL